MSKPETDFRQNKVLPFLKSLPNTFYMAIQQVSLHGDPDFVLCIRGKFIGLELKADGGYVEPMQSHKLNKIVRANGMAFVMTPKNLDMTKQELMRLAVSRNY